MATEAPRRKKSRCRCALGLALFFDALGLAGLLVGGLLETEVSDLLIYLGGVAVFFSLPWWVFWHVGNLEVPPEELRDDVGLGWRGADAWSLESWRARRLALLARAFSGHFSLPSATASASVPSQLGRPRARFAASATSGSFITGRPSEAEKLQRPSDIQEGPSDATVAERVRRLFSLPAFSFASVSTPAPQEPAALDTTPRNAAEVVVQVSDSLESTPSTHDRATQTSIFKITRWHKTRT